MKESTDQSKVFISYSRADLEFTEELAAALTITSDFEVVFDRIGIGHGEEWRERLGRLIVECDTIIFVVSPDSVSSEICAWEIEEARRLSKRIIPVLWRAVDFAKVPEGLSVINAVPFEGERAVSGLPKLVIALKSDLAWLREHTRLGEKAVEWERSGRTTSYLLRGAALAAVRDWLAAKPANAPAVTAAQREFIQASEEEESRLLSDERKRLDELEEAKALAEAERDAAQRARANEAVAARRVARATAAGLVVALVLLVAASGSGWLAYQNARDERTAAESAVKAAARAEQEAVRAASAAARAEQQRDLALLVQSRFLARAAQAYLTRGDVANAIGLARVALPKDLATPDRPYAIEPVQVIFDAYGTLRELATLRGHTGGLDGAITLPGERILTWGRDGTLRWWSVDGALLRTVVAHVHPDAPKSAEDTGVHEVIRLEDGRLLSWGVDKTARLWQDDGTFVEEFLNEDAWIRIVRLADGRIAALIGNEFRVWTDGLEPLFVLSSPLKRMMGGILLRDNRFLTWQQGPGASQGKQQYTAQLWQPDGTPGLVLEGHERSIRGGFELADGRIVTWENGPSLRVWSTEGSIETVIEKAHDYPPQQTFPLRDGRFFTWGQEAHYDHVWWARLWTAQGDSVPLIEASGSPLQGLELDDGRLLLGIDSRTPAIWHTDGTRGPVLRGHEEPAYGGGQWSDGRIATYGADRTARIWTRDGTPLLVLRGHERGVSGIKPLSGGRFLTWSFSDRTARIWSEEPRPRSLVHFDGGAAADVRELANGAIAVRTNTGSIELYSKHLEPGASLRNEARDIIDLVEISNGRLLTLGSNDRSRQPGPALRLWNSSGEPAGDLAEPDAEFVHAAQTPTGRILGFSHTGEVWAWRSDGRPESRREGTGSAQFHQVHAIPDGRFLSVGDGNRFQIWSAEGEPGAVLGVRDPMTPPKQVVSFGDGRILILFWNGPPQIREDNGEPGPSLERVEAAPTMTAVALQDGKILLSPGYGSLLKLNSDGSFRDLQYPPGSAGRHQRHQVFKLEDGRLLVSTSNQETHLLSADGLQGRKLLDASISGARLLSDGSFLVWYPEDHDLRIIHPDGQAGPVLHGHDSNIRQAFVLSDGRILSWAEDATLRIWPGSRDQAIAWADDVVARLQPLTTLERCDHYLENLEVCTADDEGVGGRSR